MSDGRVGMCKKKAPIRALYILLDSYKLLLGFFGRGFLGGSGFFLGSLLGLFLHFCGLFSFLSFAIDRAFEFRSGFEIDFLGGFDLDGLIRAGITASAGSNFFHFECTKTRISDVAIFADRERQDIKYRINDRTGLFFLQAKALDFFEHSIQQFSFRHNLNLQNQKGVLDDNPHFATVKTWAKLRLEPQSVKKIVIFYRTKKIFFLYGEPICRMKLTQMRVIAHFRVFRV